MINTLNDLSYVEFKKGRKKGSKNKNTSLNVKRHLNKAVSLAKEGRSWLNTGLSLSREKRSWDKLNKLLNKKN